MKNKIIILGIDALEYDLVEEWDLKYLKQKAYCKTDLSDFDVIITPSIWGAMLTGKKIEEIEEIFLRRARFFSEHGVNIKSNPEQYVIAKIFRKILPKKIKDYVSKNLSRKFLPDPFKKTYNIIQRKRYTTIFDFFEKIWNNGIPAYNRNVSTKEEKQLMEKAIRGDVKSLYNYSMQLYKKEKEELLKAITEDYDLIFWYTPFLDKIEHFYIAKKAKLLNIYMELNNLVKIVKEKLDDNDVLYIISDHGMIPVEDDPRGGDHSDHGFFSSNTGELIKKPQDLFYLIKKKAEEVKR